jgi:hypothetical protein
MMSFRGVFLALLFFHLNLHEVVQQAGPPYNPRGTCPRWADTPAVPGWAEHRSRQFQALVVRRRNVQRKAILTRESVRCRAWVCRERGHGRSYAWAWAGRGLGRELGRPLGGASPHDERRLTQCCLSESAEPLIGLFAPILARSSSACLFLALTN